MNIFGERKWILRYLDNQNKHKTMLRSVTKLQTDFFLFPDICNELIRLLAGLNLIRIWMITEKQVLSVTARIK